MPHFLPNIRNIHKLYQNKSFFLMAWINCWPDYKTFTTKYPNSKSTFKPREARTLTNQLISRSLYRSSPNHNDRNHDAVYSIISVNNKYHMDLTVGFPYSSIWQNYCVLIAYHYYANSIVVFQKKNWQASTITKAWQYLHEKLCSAGITPKIRILDNGASNVL